MGIVCAREQWRCLEQRAFLIYLYVARRDEGLIVYLPDRSHYVTYAACRRSHQLAIYYVHDDHVSVWDTGAGCTVYRTSRRAIKTNRDVGLMAQSEDNNANSVLTGHPVVSANWSWVRVKLHGGWRKLSFVYNYNNYTFIFIIIIEQNDNQSNNRLTVAMLMLQYMQTLFAISLSFSTYWVPRLPMKHSLASKASSKFKLINITK